MTHPVAQLNADVRRHYDLVEAEQPRLERAYRRAIREMGRVARINLLSRSLVTVAAAGEWVEPDLDELFTIEEGIEIIANRTKASHRALVRAATEQWRDVDPVILNRITGEVERLLGNRITGVAEHIRDEAGRVVKDGMDAGWSVDRTARELSSAFQQFSLGRSVMIARTEMIGAANAASLGMARESGAVTSKQWLATMDERTRETHAAADGQVVMIDEPFDVGGESLMYPGDESADPAEVVNCRCTLVYLNEPVGGDEMSAITAAASGAKGLPLSERGAKWDSGAAKGRVKDWATSGDSLDLDKASEAFFWRPGGADESWSSFKLPFADVVDGKLVAVWSGIHGAAAAVQGSRGGVDIPAGDLAGVKSRIAGYYAAASEKYDDPMIKAPWEASITERLVASGDLPSMITMPGVLRFVTTPIEGEKTATAWQGILAPIGVETADGRMLDPAEDGAISWRDLPLTLMAQFETADGHDGALVAGRIDHIEIGPATAGDWSGMAFNATGVFDDGPDEASMVAAAGKPESPGATAARLARDKTLRGISIDLSPEEYEFRVDGKRVEADDESGMLEAMLGGGVMVVTRGKIMGATLTPFPAFEEASVTVVASLEHAAAIDGAEHAPVVDEPAEVVVEAPVVPVVLSALPDAPSRDEADALIALYDAGALKLNEVRRRLGFDPVVGGDILADRRILDAGSPIAPEVAALVASLATVAGMISDRSAMSGMVDAAVENLTATRHALVASLAEQAEAGRRRPRKLSVVRDADGRAVAYEETLDG